MKKTSVASLLAVLPLILLTAVLTACAPLAPNPSLTPRYAGVAAIPKEPMQLGESRELTAGKLDVSQFPWGTSRFFALQLPASTQPYYLVVKSFFVSPPTHLKYGNDKSADFWEPRAFFPYLVFLDKDMNIIGQSRADDFHINSDIHTDLLRGFTGETWLQAAFPISPSAQPKPYYAVLSTSSDYVGKVGAVSKFYWPFGGGFWFPRIVYAPIVSPMPSYQGPMRTVRYGHVGDIQLQLVQPQELLQSTYYGRKLKEPALKTSTPDMLIQKETIIIRSPDAAGYQMQDVSQAQYVYVAFSKHKSAGQGDVAMFAQAFHTKRAPAAADKTLQSLIDDAVKEHSVALVNFLYEVKPYSSSLGHCKRIDFQGKQPRAYLADIKGYDVICTADTSDLAIRIGASALGSPAFPTAVQLPPEAEDFVHGVTLSQQKQQ